MNKAEAALRLTSYLNYIKENHVDRAIWEALETAIDCMVGYHADAPAAGNGRTIYPCDPKLNTNCSKTECYVYGGECSMTFDKEFAKQGLK